MLSIEDIQKCAKYGIDVKNHVHSGETGVLLFRATGRVGKAELSATGERFFETIRDCIRACDIISQVETL